MIKYKTWFNINNFNENFYNSQNYVINSRIKDNLLKYLWDNWIKLNEWINIFKKTNNFYFNKIKIILVNLVFFLIFWIFILLILLLYPKYDKINFLGRKNYKKDVYDYKIFSDKNNYIILKIFPNNYRL